MVDKEMVDKEKIWEEAEEAIRILPTGWKVAVIRLDGGKVSHHVFSGALDLRGVEILGVFQGIEDFYHNARAFMPEALALPEEAEEMSPREVIRKYEKEILDAYEELYLQGEI